MRNKNDFGCGYYILWFIIAAIVIGISLWITFAIANSDLPVWLKWWLLR